MQKGKGPFYGICTNIQNRYHMFEFDILFYLNIIMGEVECIISLSKNQ